MQIKFVRIGGVFLLLIQSLCAFTQDAWQPKNNRLATRWSKDVKPGNIFNEYPRPGLVRPNWINLNGLWDYAITASDAQTPDFFENRILVPFPIESALSGVKRQLQPTELLWYHRTFEKPRMKNTERLLLHFGAVDWQATVFVNEQQVGSHTGGYTSFSIDITDYLRPGRNELMVKVYDPTDQGVNPHGKQVLQPENIYYTSTSGIWQTVWMEVVPSSYIKNVIITPDTDRNEVSISVETSTPGMDVQVVGRKGSSVIAKSTGKTGEKIRLLINGPRLWSPDDPYLYGLTVVLKRNGKTLDEIGSYFGMRKIDIQKDEAGVERIFLNNRFVYNLGVLDQGFWPDGLYTAPTDEGMAFDLKAIKAMGFNTVRKHIKVEPARWYYHADRIGLMVWQDFVNPPHALPVGARAEFETESDEIMDQLYNFPSITTWVVFNERWGSYDQARLTQHVRKKDSTRLVNGHSGELLYVGGKLREPADAPWLQSDMTDVHSYPDPMVVPWQEGKARVLGEFGGAAVSVPGHQWDDLKAWGYVEVSAKELVARYASMTAKLVQLKKEGLSGSIYTQPFDVEGEENGLITYDRQILKIPIDKIRSINNSLVSSRVKNHTLARLHIEALNADEHQSIYTSMLNKYRNGSRDSALLRKIISLSIKKEDHQTLAEVSRVYLQQLKVPLAAENIIFIRRITRSSLDSGFDLLLQNEVAVDDILGKNAVRLFFNSIVDDEFFPPSENWKEVAPQWDSIEFFLRKKFGDYAAENIYGAKMAYHWTISKNADSLGKYYTLYFQKAMGHSKYHINNVTWEIFEKITDTAILAFAAGVAKFNIDNFVPADPMAIDTYANLLYKLGRREEAIAWEQKALDLSGNAENIRQYLEKMKRNEPTWINF